MLKAIIVEGDLTSHGGRVMEGHDNAKLDGKPIAALGHRVTCPKCKGVFPIIEGVPFHTFGGVDTAVEGMLTGCGAVLIASQHRMRIRYPVSAVFSYFARFHTILIDTACFPYESVRFGRETTRYSCETGRMPYAF